MDSAGQALDLPECFRQYPYRHLVIFCLLTKNVKYGMSLARRTLPAAREKLAREKLFLGLGLFLFRHAAGGAAISGGAPPVESPDLPRQQRHAGGDKEDHQKMLGPQWHITTSAIQSEKSKGRRRRPGRSCRRA